MQIHQQKFNLSNNKYRYPTKTENGGIRSNISNIPHWMVTNKEPEKTKFIPSNKITLVTIKPQPMTQPLPIQILSNKKTPENRVTKKFD